MKKDLIIVIFGFIGDLIVRKLLFVIIVLYNLNNII